MLTIDEAAKCAEIFGIFRISPRTPSQPSGAEDDFNLFDILEGPAVLADAAAPGRCWLRRSGADPRRERQKWCAALRARGRPREEVGKAFGVRPARTRAISIKSLAKGRQPVRALNCAIHLGN